MRSERIYSHRVTIVVLVVLIVVVLVDTSLIQISELIRLPSGPNGSVTLFVVIGLASAIGQILILKYAKQESKKIGVHGPLYLNYVDRVVTLVQYVLVAIFAVVILQILFLSQFSTVFLTVSTALSYLLLLAVMAFLSQRFISWFISDKNLIVLLYGLSSVVIALTSVFTLVLINLTSITMPAQIGEQIAGIPRFVVKGSAASLFNDLYVTSSIVAFVLLWTATALLLRHYFQKLRGIGYWIIICLPLAYFLTQYPALFLNLFAPMLISNPTFFGIFFTLVFALSNLTGGVLFAIAFWMAGRTLARGTIVKTYMTISAYGFILLFLTNQGILLMATGGHYPPFGLATVSLVGLSAYLILIGVYSSAISVSHDISLRKSIRNLVEKQANLLHSIGTAQMEQEIERRVIRITREQQSNLIKETGIESSIKEEDVKKYLAEVIEEVKGIKEGMRTE
jgi:hypothetical protein